MLHVLNAFDGVELVVANGQDVICGGVQCQSASQVWTSAQSPLTISLGKYPIGAVPSHLRRIGI